MSFDPDILVTALQRIEEGKTTFDFYHPVYSKIINRTGKPRVEGSPFVEFGLVPVSPESITTIVHGTETPDSGRKTGSVKGNSYPTRMLYHYDVPIKMLADINSENDLLKLIERYPMRARLGFIEKLVRQFVHGDIPEMGGFITMNGEATYAPNGAQRSGIFQFADPENQNNVVFGVGYNSIEGWYHQRRHINGYLTDGRRQMRELFYDCAEQGTVMKGDIDVIIADRGTYSNFVSELEGLLAIDSKTITGDTAPTQKQFRKGVPFSADDSSCRIYSERAITPGDYVSADAQDGVAMYFNTECWDMYRKGSSEKTTNGWFADRKPFRPGRAEVLTHESVVHVGMLCDDMRRQGIVTGGAVE